MFIPIQGDPLRMITPGFTIIIDLLKFLEILNLILDYILKLLRFLVLLKECPAVIPISCFKMRTLFFNSKLFIYLIQNQISNK